MHLVEPKGLSGLQGSTWDENSPDFYDFFMREMFS